MINLKNKNTHILFDTKGYPVVKGDPESINDTCGRLVLMGICYDFTPYIVEKLEALLIKQDGKEQIIRHPDNPVISSRDHHAYFLIYRKYTGQPLPDFPRMRGMNEWMGALQGLKDSEFWYYFWAIPGAYIGNGFLRFCRWAGDISKEYENNYWIDDSWGFYDQTHGVLFQRTRTARQKLWAWIIFQVMPAYPLHIKAWQIYVLPPSRQKDKLKSILVKRVGLSNILVRLLLGGEVTQQEITDYPHMTGYRPGVYLDETCRRDIREMDAVESEFNTYEKDLIQWLYENRN